VHRKATDTDFSLLCCTQTKKGLKKNKHTSPESGIMDLHFPWIKKSCTLHAKQIKTLLSNKTKRHSRNKDHKVEHLK